MAEWHDLQTARAEWSDAKQLKDSSLQDLLDGSKEACWGYLHPDWNEGDEVPAEVPVKYRIAQLLHARSVWQLPRGGAEGTAGIDGYTTRLYVLGYDVQKILRPPVFGEMVG